MQYSIQIALDSNHMCDTIAEKILAAHMEQDPCTRMRCRVCLMGNALIIYGNFSSFADIDVEDVVRPLIKPDINIIVALEKNTGYQEEIYKTITSESHSVGESIARDVMTRFRELYPDDTINIVVMMNNKDAHHVYLSSSVIYIDREIAKSLIPHTFTLHYHESSSFGHDKNYSGMDEYQFEKAGRLLGKWIADSIVESGICEYAQVQIAFLINPIITSVWTVPHRDNLLSVIRSEFPLCDWQTIIQNKQYTSTRFIHDFQLIDS